LHIFGSNVFHIFDLVRLYDLDQRKNKKKEKKKKNGARVYSLVFSAHLK